MTHRPRIDLAASPTTWGVDFADNPQNPAWQRVLDEIQASGLHSLELGPVGYLPEDPDVLGPELESRGLTTAGTFMFQPIYDDAQEGQVLDVARRTSRVVRELGGRFLILVDQPTELRVTTAGRSADAQRMVGADRARYLERVRRIGDIAAGSELRAVFHQHAGTNVEFLDEVEELFAGVDDDCLGMCLDTGHLAYAGIDPVDAIRRFADRIDHVHFKDVDGAVLATARAQGWDFWTAISAGIFCPIGQGVVDFAGVVTALDALEFTGTATIEQDRHPLSDTDPLADLRASIAHIEPLIAGQQASSDHPGSVGEKNAVEDRVDEDRVHEEGSHG